MQTQLLWDAIEGALGTQKTAHLKTASLNDLVREKFASEHGVDLGENFTLSDAAGALAVSWRKKKAEHRSMRDGIQAMKQVLPHNATKTASTSQRLYPRGASTFKKIAAAKKLRMLKKVASQRRPEKVAEIQEMQRRVDEDVVSSLKKEANILSAVAKHPVAKNMGKGLAIGTGLAIPGYVAGSALSDEFTEDARNRALQTAAGVGAIGLGTYGLGKGMQGMMNRPQQPQQKMGSAQGEDVSRFKTAVYLDTLLSEKPQTEKVSSVRAMSQEAAVDILCGN